MQYYNGLFFDVNTGHFFDGDGWEYGAFGFRAPFPDCNPAQYAIPATAITVARLCAGRLGIPVTVEEATSEREPTQLKIKGIKTGQYCAGLVAMSIIRYGLPRAMEYLRVELVQGGVLSDRLIEEQKGITPPAQLAGMAK